MEAITAGALAASKWILPVLALWLLLRCVRSMLRERYDTEVWGYLEAVSGERALLKHWECLIGRSRSCDITVNAPLIARTHAALVRSDNGKWTLYDLRTRGGTAVGALRDRGSGLSVDDGDTIFLSDTRMVFHDLDQAQMEETEAQRSSAGTMVSQGITLLVLTVFQVLIALQFSTTLRGRTQLDTVLGFAALVLAEWCCYFVMRALDRSGFEIETLAFFLCTLGLAVSATATPEGMLKQLVLLFAGIAMYLFLGWWLRDLRRTKLMRWPLALLALGLLALNVVAGSVSYGAMNWLSIGGVSLQPSEFVKIAYIYVGASTLDRLFRRRNLFLFIAFSAVCVGALALMGDFGTALIFFTTFLVISFLRSGSFATLFLALAGAVFAVFLILTVKPYIAQRFAAWGHIWEDPYGAGWQQTRALSAAAAGGLTGVGAGRGWLHTIFAADTDLVFCLLCEELGLVIALIAMLALIVVAFFAVRTAARGRSSYYVIAACAAASMMLVQLALNVFGSTDILPFTGVTFPFVSKGGSSLISCWALLAFIKAADTRKNASFSVKRSKARRPAPVPEELPDSDEEVTEDL